MLSPREGWKSNCMADREIWRCAQKRIVWFQRENYVTYGDVMLRPSQEMCNFCENDHTQPWWCILNLHLVRLLWFFTFIALWFVTTTAPIPTCSWRDIEKLYIAPPRKLPQAERVSPRSELHQGEERARYYMLVFHEKFASRSKFIIWVFPRTC